MMVGVVGGGVVGVVVGFMVNDKILVEGVFLIYKEGIKVYIFIQVGKECQFMIGLVVVIIMMYNEMCIQLNIKCFEKS